MGENNTVSGGARNSVAARQTKKPAVRRYIPTERIERQEAGARYRANLAAILPLAEAGAAVLPLAGKQPLAPAFPRLDAEMSPAALAAVLADWRHDDEDPDKRKGKTPEYGFGSTRTPARIAAWPRKHDELAFGLSLGPMGARVVDCDDEGGAAFLAFLAEHGEPLDLARTPATMSPGRNGRHFFFSNPQGQGGRDIAALHINLKAWGGQVVAPGQTLPPKFGEDGQLIPARTYVPVPGSLDLATALRDGTLPPLPACFVQHLIDNPSGGRGSNAENVAEAIDEAAAVLSAGPASDRPERDVGAMVEALRVESRKFDKVWQEGDPKGKGNRSGGRMALANLLLGAYGSRDFDALDLRAAYDLWDPALSGEPNDRQVSREWGKAVIDGNVGASDGAAFGSVEALATVDLDALDAARHAVEMAELDGAEAAMLAARSALADVLRDGGADDAAREVEAVDVKTSTGLRMLDKIMARCRAADAQAEAPEDDGPLPAVKQAERDTLNAERARKANRRPVYDRDVTLGSLPALQYLVDGLVVLGEVVVAAGAPGAGKSADLLHLGRCVAAGKPYHGRETERAGVLFCSSENPTEDARRTVAHRQRYGDEPDLPFAVERGALSLYDVEGKPTADERYIIASAKGMQAETGHACRLIILDNARRVIAPGDTSKEPDTVQLMKAVERIREATGAAVILIAHTVRDGTRYAGSGAIESSADSVWHYEAAVLPGATRRAAGKDVKLKAAPAYIRFDKMRTGDRNQRIEYALPVETIGEDSKGRPVNVVVSADLPTSSASHGATDGAAFGAVEDGEDDAAALGALPASPAPQAEPEAPDARLAVLLEIVREQGAGGAKIVRREVGPVLAVRLRKRKLPDVKDTKLKEYLAELVEDGHLAPTGSGAGTGYKLTGPTEG